MKVLIVNPDFTTEAIPIESAEQLREIFAVENMAITNGDQIYVIEKIDHQGFVEAANSKSKVFIHYEFTDIFYVLKTSKRDDDISN